MVSFPVRFINFNNLIADRWCVYGVLLAFKRQKKIKRPKKNDTKNVEKKAEDRRSDKVKNKLKEKTQNKSQMVKVIRCKR